ncbi:MAG: hypothetical protein AAGC64_13925 [Bacteroidota bacterium]
MLFFFEGIGQDLTESDSKCNRQGADRSITRLIPNGVCIPEGYTATKVVNDFDFNGDGLSDLAIRYIQFPLEDGNMSYYSIYKCVSDTLFLLEREFKTLGKPYVKAFSETYQRKNPIVSELIEKYPLDVKIKFIQDTIKLSHIIPDDYGKTYKFIYDRFQENWFLEEIIYWAGNLEKSYLERLELDKKLLGKVMLEEKKPENKISIDEFDLLKSKRIADEEESAYFMNNYDIFEIGAKN